MKINSVTLALVLSVGDAQPNSGDRKVPKRHPLQRLWRLYQFSEEIILLHYYKSPMKASRIDSIRGLVKKWLYMGSRESFLRGTKKCGFYDAELRPHGGPAPIGADGRPDFEDNMATELELPPEKEFRGYKIKSSVGHLVPNSIEIFRVRPEVSEDNHRMRRDGMDKEEMRVRREIIQENVQKEIDAYEYQLDGDFTDDDIDEGDDEEMGGPLTPRLARNNPCRAIKQVFVGFRKWADRYIGNCDGQTAHKHMHLRALKFYNEFRAVCEQIPIVSTIDNSFP